MTKKFFVFLTLITFIFVIKTSFASAEEIFPLQDRRIVIDAGHGGSAGGSLACNGLREANANLDIALKLQDLLETNGARVYMTRTQDVNMSNKDRYTFANSTDGEVLVSIHLNGSTDSSVDGTLGLYGKKNKDKKFAEVMHSSVWNALKSTPNFTDFGVTNFASGVLLKANMPATIAETVFISNTDECNALKDGTGNRQQEIAQSLYSGLVEWFILPPDEGGEGGGPPPGRGKPF